MNLQTHNLFYPVLPQQFQQRVSPQINRGITARVRLFAWKRCGCSV